jgi:hypothetical protein
MFKKQLNQVRRHIEEQPREESMVPLVEVVEHINTKLPHSQHFDVAEVRKALMDMSEQNLGVWYQEDVESVMFT